MQESNRMLVRSITLFLAFFTIFLSFYIRPVFFNTELQFKHMEFVPSLESIGDDFRQARLFAQKLRDGDETRLGRSNLYPPLFSAMFLPFTFFSFRAAYILVSLLAIACYFWAVVVFPWMAAGKNINSVFISMFMFFSGIISYPFQFALERGQSDVMAIVLCLSSLLIFHKKKGVWRYLAFVLFALSVNMKLFPLVFVIAFFDKTSSFKRNVLRMMGIGLLSFMMLLSLGLKSFLHFFSVIADHSRNPYVWEGNSSVKSFFSILAFNAKNKLAAFSPEFADFLCHYPVVFQVMFGCLFLIIIFHLLWMLHKRTINGLEPELLLICSIASLTLPSVSHDYRIIIMTGPLTYFLIQDVIERKASFNRLFWTKEFFVFLVACLYFSCGYFWFYKDHNWFFKINFPSLALIMVLVYFNLLFRQRTKTLRAD